MKPAACATVVLALAGVSAWAGKDLRDPAVEIYPTAARLPANLLRVYLLFDRPMSAGELRAHLAFLDDAGRRVEGAFLHLEEELWDPSGRRLTVLFDPGRIKRGLRANVESGAPLVEGHRYRLVVDGGWRDAEGHALGADTVKVFEAVAPDRTAPAVEDWAIEAPAAATRQPLAVCFPEILDRALLSSAIGVVDWDGRPLQGEIEVAAGEERWLFTPDHAWKAGKYGLRVSAELEDVAGNSLRRVFDADIQRTATPPRDDGGLSIYLRPFQVSGTLTSARDVTDRTTCSSSSRTDATRRALAVRW